VKLNTQLRRHHASGFEAGVQVNNRSWKWARISARRVDAANRRAPEAYAQLLEATAVEHEAIAQGFLDTAAECRVKAALLRRGTPAPDAPENPADSTRTTR
jgi:hypothetical protein